MRIAKALRPPSIRQIEMREEEVFRLGMYRKNAKPSIPRSLGLGITIGLGVSAIVAMLSGCSTAPVGDPVAESAPFIPAPRSMLPMLPSLVVVEAARVFIPSQTSVVKRGSLSLAWSPSPDSSVTGYRLHYGNNSGSYQHTTDVGSVTNATLTGLDEGTAYYVSATAYDATGADSDFSNEVIGVTEFAVSIRMQRWEVSAWGLRGETNQMQMSTNLIDWETIHEWVGNERAVVVLHNNGVNSWFRVMVK